MKEIELTRGLVALVDDEDYEYLNQWNWQATKGRSIQYYAKRDRLMGDSCAQSVIKMHRAILELHDIDISDKEVDHINNNGLDNQKANLRIATGAENHRNSPKRRNSPSPYKGVFFLKKANRWMAALTYQGKSVYLGIYKTPEDARDAYDAGAKKYFGKFAKANSESQTLSWQGQFALPTKPLHYQRKRKTTTSKYKGVSANRGGWSVEIRYNGKRIYGGWYKQEIDAARAYNELMTSYYGEDFVKNDVCQEVVPGTV